MTSPASAASQSPLLVFSAGGLPFAVEAAAIAQVAGGDWQPAANARLTQSIDLAALLGLPQGERKRTLVLPTPQGPCGFQVDSISRQEVSLKTWLPVPSLLADWAKPLVVIGFVLENEQVISVLNLADLMAHWADKTGRNHS